MIESGVIKFENIKIDLNKLLITKNKSDLKINATEKMILDKLQNPNLTSQYQEWNFITDQVMGGVSSGLFKVEKFDKIKKKISKLLKLFRYSNIVISNNFINLYSIPYTIY